MLRSVFRSCLGSFVDLSTQPKWIPRVVYTHGADPHSYPNFSMPGEEYCADFCLTARRVLNDSDYDLFRLWFLRGLEWREACSLLNLDRVSFYRAVYWIEEQLGRAFFDAGMFPLSKYYGR